MNTENIKYLNRTGLQKRVGKLNDDYWVRSWHGRWKYMWPVINEMRIINPATILEIGAYKINLTNISDNIDLKYKFIDKNNLNNKVYIQDATTLPWDMPDKYYDVVVALQVFEHFKNNMQNEVFKEIMRVSKSAILSFPYLWNKPRDKMHHMITKETIDKWTCSIIPEKIIEINFPIKRRRIIYIFKF